MKMKIPLLADSSPFATVLGLVLVLAFSPSAWGQSEEEMMEMEDGSGESMESSAPSKPTVSLTETGPSPLVLWQMSHPNFTALGDELARLVEPSTVAPAPIATGPTLRNEAHVAFRYGNLPLARELFFGHLALGGEAAKRDLETVQFSAQFRRPAWHMRWGLAIGLSGDTDVTDFDPIAANMSTTIGRGMDAEMGMGMDDEMAMEEDRMESESGMSDGPDMMGMDDENGGQERKTPRIEAPEAESVDPSVAERLRELTGMMGDKLTEGLSARIQGGKFGSALTDVAEQDPTQGYMVGGDTVSPADKPMWIPGVAFVGEGATREMTETAAKEGIELLLYVVVSVKESRTGDVQNISRAKIVDCKTGKTLVASGGIDNHEVKRLIATKRGTAEGYVDEQLETFWKIVDSRLALSPLPTLTPEVSRKRITQLMADASYSKLRKLAEVRLFNQKAWVTDEELEQAYEIIAGADGIKILYAPLSESIPQIRELVRYSLMKEVE